MFMEMGPLLADANGDISINPLSWNRFANILFGKTAPSLR
jgi:carboxypeptidase C (cathepsin A)